MTKLTAAASVLPTYLGCGGAKVQDHGTHLIPTEHHLDKRAKNTIGCNAIARCGRFCVQLIVWPEFGGYSVFFGFFFLWAAAVGSSARLRLRQTIDSTNTL
jgi:hypothetical protein